MYEQPPNPVFYCGNGKYINTSKHQKALAQQSLALFLLHHDIKKGKRERSMVMQNV